MIIGRRGWPLFGSSCRTIWAVVGPPDRVNTWTTWRNAMKEGTHKPKTEYYGRAAAEMERHLPTLQ